MVTSTLYCDACGAACQQQARFCFSCGKPLQTSSSAPQQSAPNTFVNHPSTGTITGNLPSQHLLKQRYRICTLLGQGGMGAVYKAQDTAFADRLVAVKETRPLVLPSEESRLAIDAFKREALLLAGLMHPHMPRIFDHFSEAGRWYLVMDFIDGITLEIYLHKSQHGSLPVEEVIEIGMQLCTVLDYLHTRQPPVIFRDLKPDNIIRTPNGHLYLIDFGIARHFKVGQLKDTIPFGSVGYAAPEQYGKMQTSPRADIYSLGATLHQLLSGHSPALNPFLFAPFLRTGQSIPAELEALIMQMVDLDENNRPASVAVIQQELQRIADRKTSAHIDTVRLNLKDALAASPATTCRLYPMGTTLIAYHGHADRLMGLAWSPDGKYIASASADKTVQVWEASSGKTVITYAEHTEWVKAVVWSPDGMHIASAGADMTVHLWDVMTGRTVLIYRGHSNLISTVAWSPDSKYIASGGYDRTIAVWDAFTGEDFGFYHGHAPQNMINAVSWSPDSRCIASGSDDGTVHIWPVEHIRGIIFKQKRSFKKSIFVYSKHTGWVKAVAWSPNGKRMASGSWDNTVHLWDPTNGHFFYIHAEHTSWINAVAWSPNSARLATASNDGAVHVFDANTGRELFTKRTFFTYEGHRDDVRAVAWSPDGTRIASGGNDGVVKVWDAG
ncbi:MAG TPA: protein kinase [Ktedonobacteraceae bacterium]|nr:protein kinase [Ktedonobacteraceae bacterium]